jgi:hypothetical protein
MPGLVRLADRRDALRVLAFPRGISKGRFGERGRYRSVEADGRWTLKILAEQRSDVMIQASMRTLDAPFEPCSVKVNGRPLPSNAWTFDAATGVLRTQIQERRLRIEALACKPQKPASARAKRASDQLGIPR